MTKTLTTLLLVAGVLTGCTLAPHYDRPAPPVADSFPVRPRLRHAEAKSGETRRAADIGWREFFRDPRLQSLIATSLETTATCAPPRCASRKRARCTRCSAPTCCPR